MAAGLVCGATVDSSAQVATPPGQVATPPAPSSAEFQVGVEERFRFESADNLADHSDAYPDKRMLWRFRTRAWATGRLGGHFAFGVGLNNESKGQAEPKLPLTLDETIFESLWIDIVPHPRLSIRVGRQDIKRGDGLILWDATPGDAARSDYTNGIDARITVVRDATFEVILASNPSYDVYLPVIRDQHRRLIEWQERMAGVYYTDTRKPGLDVQAYYFFKREEHDTRPPTHPQFQPDRSLSTVGVRVVRAVKPAWTFSGEAAAQFGEQVPQAPIRSWAGSVSAQYRLAAPWTPTVRASDTGLSGDSPATPTIERWDPIVGRWPMW
ncbi:MAG: alginate export family protein, partial [Acidobacteria bacterium]|nr:alginate export family protein [Acidobacteriota bacterium]